MEGKQSTDICFFNELHNKYVPNILEKIFFYLDYDSFKTCMKVNMSWSKLLKSEYYQKRARSVFKSEILEDQEKLSTAAMGGRTEEARRLLSSGILDVDGKPVGSVFFEHSTPLNLAITFKRSSEVAMLLIENGADISQMTSGDPMKMVSMRGHDKIIELMLERGWDPDKEDNTGRTPLHWAAKYGHKNVTQVLLGVGVQLNKTDKDGETPLHLAASGQQGLTVQPLQTLNANYFDLFQLLVDRGADPNKPNSIGKTPFRMWILGR